MRGFVWGRKEEKRDKLVTVVRNEALKERSGGLEKVGEERRGRGR